MKNTDTRVQMTKRLLYASLLEALKEKPISAVTVKEIVDAAGINRGTFYLHYDSPMSLLKDMENTFIQSNLVLFESFMRDDYDRTHLERLYAGVWKEREMFCALLGPHGDPNFSNTLREFARERTVEEWNKEFPQYSREHLNFLFDFVFPGLSGLLIRWLQEEHPVSAEEFGRRVERLGHYALLCVKEFR